MFQSGIVKTLSIVYRTCNKELNALEFNQSRPLWFDKKKCWDSFFNSFGNKPNINIFVVFDGNETDELAMFINKYKINDIVYLHNIGNKNSLIYCYNKMKSFNSDYIAIFEDDYLWLPNSLELLFDGLERFGQIATISLYNHPDRVFRTDDVTFGKEYIFAGKYCYWRTAESNTATFAINYKLFDKHYQEFIDCDIHDRLLFINLLQKYNLRHFTPISERFGATHVNQFFPSLYIDWEKYNKSL